MPIFKAIKPMDYDEIKNLKLNLNYVLTQMDQSSAKSNKVVSEWVEAKSVLRTSSKH